MRYPQGGKAPLSHLIHPHLLAKRGFFKRFLREADVGRKVRHENVVATLEVDATLVDGQQHNFLRDHAPEEYREAMIRNVPLHRDIMAAREERQG